MTSPEREVCVKLEPTSVVVTSAQPFHLELDGTAGPGPPSHSVNNGSGSTHMLTEISPHQQFTAFLTNGEHGDGNYTGFSQETSCVQMMKIVGSSLPLKQEWSKYHQSGDHVQSPIFGRVSWSAQLINFLGVDGIAGPNPPSRGTSDGNSFTLLLDIEDVHHDTELLLLIAGRYRLLYSRAQRFAWIPCERVDLQAVV